MVLEIVTFFLSLLAIVHKILALESGISGTLTHIALETA